MRPPGPVRCLLAAMTLLALPLMLEPAASAQGYPLPLPPGPPPAHPGPRERRRRRDQLPARAVHDRARQLGPSAEPVGHRRGDAAIPDQRRGVDLGSEQRPGRGLYQNGAAVTGVPSSGPGSAYFQPAEPRCSPTRRRGPARPRRRWCRRPRRRPLRRWRPCQPRRPFSPARIRARELPSFRARTTPAPRLPSRTLHRAPRRWRPRRPRRLRRRPLRPNPPAATVATSSSSTGGPGATGPESTQGSSGTASSLRRAPAATCPPAAPSPLGRLALALGGALCGGLAVALWTRPRVLRGKSGVPAK